MLNYAWAVLGVAVVLFGTLFIVFPRIGFTFTPPSDTGELIVTHGVADGYELGAHQRPHRAARGLLLCRPAGNVGASHGGLCGHRHGGLESDPRHRRRRISRRARAQNTEELAVVYEQRIRELLANTPEASINLATEVGGPPTRSSYELNLVTNDLDNCCASASPKSAPSSRTTRTCATSRRAWQTA